MMRRKTKPAAGAVRPTADGVCGALPVLPEGLALPARVKARSLARIRPKRQKAPAPAPAGGRFEPARASEGWRETLLRGRCKTLAVDDERDVVLRPAAMAPGARFPDYPYDASADEGVMISGEVNLGGRLMLSGDDDHTEIGTEQINVTSPSGCTALLSRRATAWRQWQVSLIAR